MKTGSLLRATLASLALCAAAAVNVPAQGTTTTRRQTTTTTTTTQAAPRATPTPGAVQEEQEATTTPTVTPAAPATRGRRTTTTTTTTARASAQPGETAAAKAVRAAFDALIDGISRADVEAVTDVYWNSPQLLVFNYNGTTTRTWAQVRANRESSYPNIKDAKVVVRDVRVQMLGTTAALVTCLWTQTQTYKGQPETSSGRLTLVFRRLANEWKAIHTHTSPDAPDPSRVPPSEQTTTTTTTTARP